MTDRLLCIKERYQSKQNTGEVFEQLWGQKPGTIRVLREPKCLNERERLRNERDLPIRQPLA